MCAFSNNFWPPVNPDKRTENWTTKPNKTKTLNFQTWSGLTNSDEETARSPQVGWVSDVSNMEPQSSAPSSGSMKKFPPALPVLRLRSLELRNRRSLELPTRVYTFITRLPIITLVALQTLTHIAWIMLRGKKSQQITLPATHSRPLTTQVFVSLFQKSRRDNEHQDWQTLPNKPESTKSIPLAEWPPFLKLLRRPHFGRNHPEIERAATPDIQIWFNFTRHVAPSRNWKVSRRSLDEGVVCSDLSGTHWFWTLFLWYRRFHKKSQRWLDFIFRVTGKAWHAVRAIITYGYPINCYLIVKQADRYKKYDAL